MSTFILKELKVVQISKICFTMFYYFYVFLSPVCYSQCYWIQLRPSICVWTITFEPNAL